MNKNYPNVVVVGGGTGTSVVLSGLKKHPVNVSAIISVADSGGSTGRLRDEFGFLPVGDMRQSLAALAESKDQAWIQKLLLYRFNHGEGLQGHNLGNLMLTALQDMAGSTPKAIEIAERIFNLEGSIFPVTDRNVELVVEYTDGTFVIGEHHLNPEKSGGKKIKHIRLSPKAPLYAKAKQALMSADMIVIGPGDLYASLLPNLVVGGIKSVFKQSKAKIVYVVNLMTSFTQTHHYSATDHIAEITKYIGRKPDFCIINHGAIPPDIAKAYQKQQEHAVIDDVDRQKYTVIAGELVGVVTAANHSSDTIKRSLLRHHQEKLTGLLLTILHPKA
ncbi:hypothetical protein A3B57_04000 [Microgenomates group bacterium RIFCSPLOWO2_01_FULL_47_10]|nr:MAG: hypothetical protein A3B57_04000 [Microgenomates group bacterium RIFCSPLOWO2_01_FULL_47_10]